MKFLSSFLSLFTPSQRRKYYLAQVYFLFAGLVQVAGVASVAPFIALVSRPGLIHSNAFAQGLYTRFGFESDSSFLIAIAIMLMLLIIASNVVLAGAVWLISAFGLRLGLAFQRDIYRGFLRRDYVTFSRTNSASLVAIITEDTMRLVFMVVQPVLTLTSQVVIVALIVGGLVWYDPTVALIAAVLVGGGYAIVFHVVRHQLQTTGHIAWEAHRAKFRLLAESLGGIKEIKLMGTETLYENRLRAANEAGSGAASRLGLLGDLPRFVLEPTAFCALLGLGIYLLMLHRDSQSIVGVLSLYAMAGYKLLPAAQQIFKSASTIRANGGLIEQLRPEIVAGRLVVAGNTDSSRAPLPPGDIHFEDVWYEYPGTGSPVIKGANLTIPRNRVTVFVGPSGSGKSTLADMLLALLTPTRGRIRVGDHSITDAPAQWQRGLGYVSQNIFLLDDTIAANISFGSASDTDLSKVKRAASLASIAEFVESLPGQYDYIVGERGATLSGGQKQRVGIARALYHDADVLILDEATSALDSVTEQEIIATINTLKASKTIVMIAHRLSTIRGADLIVLVRDGTIQGAGSFEEMMTTSADFRAIVAAGQDESITRTA